jgi:hypothetical protein
MTKVSIRVDRQVVKYAVPSSVFRQSQFKWVPQDVCGLTRDQQLKSLTNWINGRSIGPQVFVITSYEQLRAEYAAAYLVESHINHNPYHDVLWYSAYDEPLDRYTAEFTVPAKKRENVPTLIICTNLGLQTTRTQFEKVRDLWARWPQVPLVVAGYGRNPVELANELCMPLHGGLHINPIHEVLDV